MVGHLFVTNHKLQAYLIARQLRDKKVLEEPVRNENFVKDVVIVSFLILITSWYRRLMQALALVHSKLSPEGHGITNLT